MIGKYNGPMTGRGPQSTSIQEILRAALVHHQAGQLAEAGKLYRQALTLDPNHADSLHLLGMVAFQSGRNDLAVELIRKAIANHKTGASYYSNLGNVLQAQDQLHEAAESYRQALALRPDLAEVHVNLGNVLRAQGQVEQSLSCYRKALALKPDLAEAAAGESMALLLKGDYEAGWKSFERRWQTRDYDTPMRNYTQPLWTGEPLENGRLLLWGEQGIGDEIMFAGLVPDVLRTGTCVVLDCDARLEPLFARSFPAVEIGSGDATARHVNSNIAAHLPSGSLPGLYRRSLNEFAGTSSYLVADVEVVKQFRDKYPNDRPLVGIAWHTNNAKSGRKRSIDLNLFAPLFERTNAQCISLQYGDFDRLKAQIAGKPILLDRSVNQLIDIDRFAAQVRAMDLVITIDNSTAHLGGALGVTTWVLLPYAPDWRWGIKGDKSLWYPSVRLFRQEHDGDWESVIGRVIAALADS